MNCLRKTIPSFVAQLDKSGVMLYNYVKVLLHLAKRFLQEKQERLYLGYGIQFLDNSNTCSYLFVTVYLCLVF